MGKHAETAICFNPLRLETGEMINDFFLDIQENETIRIISGEASPEVTASYEDILRRAHKEKAATIKVLVGPIICVTNGEKGTRSKGNAYLRLAGESALTIYSAPLRQIRHLKIAGERKVLVENYHECLASLNDRDAVTMENCNVAQKCADDFDIDISAFGCQEISGTFSRPYRIICLTKDEIQRIKEHLTEPEIAVDLLGIDPSTFHTIMHIIKMPGRLYDFLTYERAMTLLENQDLFRSDMILGHAA